MAIAAGTRFNHYEILAPLGAGGMGEVYRAKDTRLDRAVAIKVLPADFAKDADRLKRFEQEARATSALNHPNILTVYDIGNHAGAPFIVAELLEGGELREQLNEGALPVRKAIEYAQQIAAGLAAAHEKGIVHRDLKPENLFVTKDGRVKILDFGLAKLKPQKLAGDVDSEAPTMKPLTNPGVVMGTVGYMSPEQVRGQEIDHRSDIFSFGIILHEMLSGQRTFSGASLVELMNAILKDEPAELSETNAKISPALDKLTLRCLEKLPERRFQTASDLGFALEAFSMVSSSGANRTEAVPVLEMATPTKRSGWREHIGWIAAGIFALTTLALGLVYFRRPVLEAEPMRLSITPPEKVTRFDWPTISPDGRTLAFIAEVEGKTQLWVRPLNSTTAKPLAEADHSSASAAPFWSADSQSLAFVSERKLRKIALTGGAAEPLCDVENFFRGGTWNQDGVILFSDSSQGIRRVSARGGAVTTLIKADPAQGQTRVRGPVFLPDGRHFVYHVNHNELAKDAIWLASIESGERTRLVESDSATIGVASNPSASGEGQLVFVRQGVLQAQSFDFGSRQLMGEPVRVAETVYVNANNFAKFSLARNGTLVLLEGRGTQQPAWFDRKGKRLETVGQPGRWLAYQLSPDGQRLVAERLEGASLNADLRLLDLARGTDTRFTFDPLQDQRPIWSPDGNRIAWASNREGVPNLYWKAASGAGQDELLLRSAYTKSALNWSADGRFILYYEINPQTSYDLCVLPLEGERKPWPWLNTAFNESNGAFSPDGKWVAYQSNEAGSRNEIFVQSFVPGASASGGKWQISTNGGVKPTWRHDGRELFFVSPDNKLMAVDVTLGTEVKAGTPREIFPLSGIRPGATGSLNVTADGQRFLFAVDEATGLPPFTVVLNWLAEGKK